MKPKTMISTVLLVFVAASVFYLVAGKSGRESAAQDRPAGSEKTHPGSSGPSSRVVAYYFHGTRRCPTCLSIEKTAREALTGEFSDQLASGALQWRSVNFEDGENEHFMKDFELTAASLVLVREAGGEVKSWNHLEQTWDLIGDDARFRAYVVDQTREYLDGS